MRGTSNIFAFIVEILIACLKQNYEMNYAFGYVLLTNFSDLILAYYPQISDQNWA